MKLEHTEKASTLECNLKTLDRYGHNSMSLGTDLSSRILVVSLLLKTRSLLNFNRPMMHAAEPTGLVAVALP
jgi:hypothetical protein